ncbi:MAG: cysteine--tRNA ligase [Candidatus Levybacteria bacterium]|nr:cysteine--tRNA ligase [Candidatus Levybacteria bacterium]
MQLYNTFSRQLEEFTPISGKKVTLYTCGPTVYRDIHIGNFRTYLTTDILRRILKANEYEVTSVMNITDVGHFRLSKETNKVIDPVVEEANKLGITPLELSKTYTEQFVKDARKLNILEADVLPKASDHIEEMIEVIKVLLDKGYAYEADGNVYFKVEKFKDYGKLSGNTLGKMDQLLEAVRVSVETDKKDTADFALWKRADDRVMSWESPWGMGVPGWHIECSVMSMKYLGVSLDIHAGGEDLVFPHHEDEIAQSEALTGEKFVKTWVHTSFLSVEEEKMSRSKGNVFILSDLINKGYTPLAFRYLTYQTHYRAKMNFTWEALDGAATALNKIYDIAGKLPEGEGYADKYEVEFLHVLNQDMNMPKALSIVWEMLRSDFPDQNKAAALRRMDEVLGLKIFETAQKLTDIPENVLELSYERDKLRKEGRYMLADQIRHKIENMGFEVLDGKKVEGKKTETKILRKL